MVATAFILFLASLIQGVVGFALALFSVPLLLNLGHSLPEAVALVLVGSMVQSLMGVGQLREHVPWRQVLPSAGWRLAALPFGVSALHLLSGLGQHRIQVMVALFILAAVAARKWGGRYADYLKDKGKQTFLLSGFCMGLVGMGGPPLILWLLAQNWSVKKSRGFLFGLYLLCVPANLLLLALGFKGVVSAMVQGLLCSPAMMLGSFAGVLLGNRLPRHRLESLALAILTLIALKILL